MRRALVLVVCVGWAFAACDRFKKKEDAGSEEAGTTTTTSAEDAAAEAEAEAPVVDAGAPEPQPSIAENESAIKRFPDEEKVDPEEFGIEWSKVDAKTEPGATGAVVATLAKGAKATLRARREGAVLATFPDPKNATKTLLGWIIEDAFVPGTAPPPTTAIVKKPDGGISAPPKATTLCPAGLTLLFAGDAFCGRVCKIDKDCPAGTVCQGKAAPITTAGIGAPTLACVKATHTAHPDAGAPAASDAGARPDAGAAPAAHDAGHAAPRDAGKG